MLVRERSPHVSRPRRILFGHCRVNPGVHAPWRIRVGHRNPNQKLCRTWGLCRCVRRVLLVVVGVGESVGKDLARVVVCDCG